MTECQGDTDEQRIRPVVIALLGLAFAMTASETKGDEFYYVDDLRVAVEPEAAAIHAHLGDVHPGRRRGARREQLRRLPAHDQLAAAIARRPDLESVPEPGVNLDLYRTLDAVYQDRENVTMWGPFRILPLGLRAFAPGQGDPRQRGGAIPGDQHAAEPADQRLHPCRGRGRSRLRPRPLPADPHRQAGQPVHRPPGDDRGASSTNGESDNSWLIPRLGLDRYPIEVVPPQQIPKRNCFLCRCPE